MVFHLVNSDYRVTGTVAFQFKTSQWRQSESREWSLHLIPIGHLGLFVRVEGVVVWGRRGWGIFFQVETTASILYRPTLWWGYRSSSDSQSLNSWGYTAILCVVTERSSPLPEGTKNSWLQTHSNWAEKGIWTIIFVGLDLVTYWNSLCPRLEKWKLCR